MASAAALNTGVDLDLGATYGQPTSLAAAFSVGAVSEATIDRVVKRIMLARVSLGEMDDTATRAADPLSKIGLGAIDTPQSRQLAHDMVVESIVLLKNEKGKGKAMLPKQTEGQRAPKSQQERPCSWAECQPHHGPPL